jgi:single-strand DNA-binding protein
MALNKVMLIGYLGRDPEMRTLPNGQTVGHFSIATKERFRDREGLRQEHTEWHNIAVFGRLAQTCETYLKKGRQVYIEGRLRTHEYESAQSGGKRKRTEIIALRVQFLGSAPEVETTGEDAGADEDIPF